MFFRHQNHQLQPNSAIDSNYHRTLLCMRVCASVVWVISITQHKWVIFGRQSTHTHTPFSSVFLFQEFKTNWCALRLPQNGKIKATHYFLVFSFSETTHEYHYIFRYWCVRVFFLFRCRHRRFIIIFFFFFSSCTSWVKHQNRQMRFNSIQ